MYARVATFEGDPARVDDVEVARQAGHSPSVTLSTDAHLFEELEGTALGRGRDPPRQGGDPKLAYPFCTRKRDRAHNP
jgi:hypothetical protein